MRVRQAARATRRRAKRRPLERRRSTPAGGPTARASASRVLARGWSASWCLGVSPWSSAASLATRGTHCGWNTRSRWPVQADAIDYDGTHVIALPCATLSALKNAGDPPIDLRVGWGTDQHVCHAIVAGESPSPAAGRARRGRVPSLAPSRPRRCWQAVWWSHGADALRRGPNSHTQRGLRWDLLMTCAIRLSTVGCVTQAITRLRHAA